MVFFLLLFRWIVPPDRINISIWLSSAVVLAFFTYLISLIISKTHVLYENINVAFDIVKPHFKNVVKSTPLQWIYKYFRIKNRGLETS